MDEICCGCGEFNEWWNGDESDELCLDCSIVKSEYLNDINKER